MQGTTRHKNLQKRRHVGPPDINVQAFSPAKCLDGRLFFGPKGSGGGVVPMRHLERLEDDPALVVGKPAPEIHPGSFVGVINDLGRAWRSWAGYSMTQLFHGNPEKIGEG